MYPPPGGVRLYRVFKKVLQANTFFNIHIPHHTCCCMYHVPSPDPRKPVVQNTQPLMSSSGPTGTKQVVGWLIGWLVLSSLAA